MRAAVCSCGRIEQGHFHPRYPVVASRYADEGRKMLSASNVRAHCPQKGRFADCPCRLIQNGQSLAGAAHAIQRDCRVGRGTIPQPAGRNRFKHAIGAARLAQREQQQRLVAVESFQIRGADIAQLEHGLLGFGESAARD
jgi:hypothetical protein